MKSDMIMPFITSVQAVFETMLHMRVEVGTPFLNKDGGSSRDVTAIIGMSGDIQGTVGLSFKLDAAVRTASIFAGCQLDPGGADFVDAVGELANMISGGAKAKFKDKTVSISCPSVVMGKEIALRVNSDSTCVVLPCSCDSGEFQIEVIIRQAGTAKAFGPDAAKAA